MKKLIPLPLLILLSTNSFAGENVVDDIQACAAVKNSLERLVCYDNISKNLRGDGPAIAYPAKQAVSRERSSGAPAPTVKRAEPATSFGLEYQAIENTPDEMRVSIASSEKDVYGKLTITTSDGQVWKQIDSRKLKIDQASPYVISKGALGAFYMQAEGENRRIKVKRIQ